MLIMREALPLMEGVPGASFTFVSSVSALYGSAHNSAYGAAKAALVSLVRSAAVEFGPLQIRVNTVASGIIWTPRFAEILGDQGRRANDENTPLGTSPSRRRSPRRSCFSPPGSRATSPAR
jgi:NAD(P)-dependent dehydrogenase (short-subunit alcohol dehydrogenase family)